MEIFKKAFFSAFKLLLFWILVFDFQRILFSIHNLNKLQGVSFGEWLLAFIYSIRVDFAMASMLSAIPFLLLVIHFVVKGKWGKIAFYSFLTLELFLVVLTLILLLYFGMGSMY